jgi:tocopherol O-methyltransferase
MIRPRGTVTPADVASHYDELDPMYRAIWGEHVHHGYWITGREDAGAAVVALAELVAARLDLSPGMTVCDIGCGYGATAELLAERHGANVTGVTISAAQAALARRRVPARGSLAVQVTDWLANRFADGGFDRACAIESSEHMPDQRQFFREAWRVLKPGGRLVVCAWLAREHPRGWEVRHVLEPICREGRLTGLGSEAEYRAMAEAAGFRVLSFQDISTQVRRTWVLCLRRLAAALVSDAAYLRYLLDLRSGQRVFALTLVRLLLGYRTGSIRYGVFVLGKPPA